MSSLATFSQKMRIFLPPSAGAVTSLMSMICSSFLALASKMLVEHTGLMATVNLPVLGSSRKAYHRSGYQGYSYKLVWTWKHNFTAFRSMEEAFSKCLNPCLKGSTLISCLCLSDSSISFFLTHWIPRCWNSTVISSELTCKVHTPRLQPSFPTYNKCERIRIACWINEKVDSFK